MFPLQYQRILQTIGKVVHGGEKCYLQLTPRPIESDFSDDIIKAYKLIKREIELINMLKEGKSTKEIANDLCLSIFTIETHRKNILRKLQVKNVAEMITFALRNKIITYNS